MPPDSFRIWVLHSLPPYLHLPHLRAPAPAAAVAVHPAEEVAEAVGEAGKNDFNNISLDFILIF